MYTENERRVLKLLRCLNWEDEQISEYVVKCLSSAWKIKFHRIAALANLVAGLVEYQVITIIHSFQVLFHSEDGYKLKHFKYKE